MSAVLNKYTQEWKRDENGVIVIPDEFLNRVAIEEGKLKRTFSQLGNRDTQPKHKGDKMVREHIIPVLHPLNRIDGGVDATRASLVEQVFYAYDSDGTPTDSIEYADAATALAATDGTAGTGTVRSGAGSLYHGEADYNTVGANFPSLDEEGGNVNGVNSISRFITANVYKFGMMTGFTKDSLDKDMRGTLLITKTKALAEAQADVRESQVQYDLITAGMNNVLIATGDPLITTQGTMNSQSVVTYDDLEALELQLKKDRVPMDTRMITGTTKIDTVTVQKAWYMYVGMEVVKLLRNMTNGGIRVWEPVESYAAGSKEAVAEGEIGRIGAFRFIEVYNMQSFKGANGGAAVDLVNTAAGQAGEFNDETYHDGSNYQVFPMLLVGSDSFATIGYEGATTSVIKAMPKPIPGIDPYGEKGSISIKWWFGTMIYRPERIHVLLTVGRK